MNFVPCCKTLSFFQLFKYPCTFRRKMRPIDGFKLQIICRLTKLKCGKKFNNFVFRSIFQVDGSLHLKSFLNMAGPGVISVGAGPEAQSILKRMEREATHRYQTLTLPEDRAANCLFVNGTLIHRSKAEAPKSDPVRTHRKQIWRRIIHYHDFSLLSFFLCRFSLPRSISRGRPCRSASSRKPASSDRSHPSSYSSGSPNMSGDSEHESHMRTEEKDTRSRCVQIGL